MKNPKTKMTAWKLGALLITSSLCISTLGISYSYFGESLMGKASMSVAKMNIEGEETGKIEYDYENKILKVIFDLKNTGEIPVKIYIKSAEATYNSFSDESEKRVFMEYEDKIFDDALLEPDEMEKEFTLEFINVHVEDNEYGYFETEIEVEYVNSETESWKDTLKIEAVDENRRMQAERYLEYLTSLEAQSVQPTPGAPSEPAPEVPAPEAPVQASPEVPSEPAPEAPVQPSPEVPAPEAPVQPPPEVPAPEAPVQPSPEVPSEPAPEAPVQSPPEVPSEPAPEAPAEPKSEAPAESSAQEQNDSEVVIS
ncbi:hypothetical protein [Proteocatella sphenisci]|uniref:hypothetical protein n=1 Tax=Proteocatella sphenisci TaxID=181070 RepID=UPI00049101D6|nr:hypothetical protein [Proteocatella sphenisci]